MKNLSKTFSTMFPSSSKSPSCPDCQGEMMNGECLDCGYGGMEEEDEQMETQSLLDLKKQLQSAMELVDRMIVKNCD
jgi:radical SAM superfamily enzyme